MEKKLYFELDDGDSVTIMELSGCMSWIKAGTEGLVYPDTADQQYGLTPIWLTDEEYNSLPEN